MLDFVKILGGAGICGGLQVSVLDSCEVVVGFLALSFFACFFPEDVSVAGVLACCDSALLVEDAEILFFLVFVEDAVGVCSDAADCVGCFVSVR